MRCEQRDLLQTMCHSHLPMVILHLNQANKTRVYLLRSLSRKLSMLFEKLRECTRLQLVLYEIVSVF